MPRALSNPYFLLTVTALCWSSNMVIGRAVAGDVPPLLMAFGRWSVAAMLAIPAALPYLRQDLPQLVRGWRPLLVLALLGIAGFNSLTYVGLALTSATNASLLNSVVPIATMALSWALLGKRLSPREWLGVLVSLAGVLVIVGRGSVEVLAALTLNAGDLWILLSVLDWALYSVALAWKPANVHRLSLLAAMIAIGLVALVPFVAWEYAQGERMVVHAGSVAAILYVGVFPGFLSYVFYNRGVEAIGPGKASLFLHLLPVFGTLLAAVFLGEVPRWYHGVGIALVFAGIAMTMGRAEAKQG